MKVTSNPKGSDLPDIACAAEPQKWLSACPAHSTTPLRNFEALATSLGFAQLIAKDETGRMGLGSFKALGGAYAVLQIVKSKLQDQLKREPTQSDIVDPKNRRLIESITVCCASAGNHGLSVAAGARVFGVSCEVFLSDTVPDGFAKRLRAHGAIVKRGGSVYEDSMRAAVERAKAANVTLVSDASWEGEMIVPSFVMQGYAVLGEELLEDFRNSGEWLSHVAIQAGVGGLAATITEHIRRTWPEQPEIIIVEPDRAPCLEQSVKKGEMTRVDGEVSNMGRLDCKEPSLRAFDVLRSKADRFVLISDAMAEEAVKLLASEGVSTTPSGAAGLAGLIETGLPKDARALIIVTEGEVE